MLLLEPIPQLSPYFAIYTANLWSFFLFFCYILFCVIVTIRFVQTYRIGKGHYISGMIGCTLIWMYVPVLFTSNSMYWIVNLCPLPIMGISVMMGYNDWYFYKWPQYEAWLDSKDKREDVSTKLGTFGQDTAFGRFVLQPQAEHTSWPYRHYKIGLGLVAFLLTFAFGFWKSTENLSAGASIATKNTQQVVEKTVSKVEQKIVGKIEASVDSSAARTQKITSKIDSSNQARQAENAKTNANIDRSAKKADAASAEARRAVNTAERFRNAPLLIVQPAQVPPVGGTRPLDLRTPKLRGRKTGMLDTDSLERVQMARYNVDANDDANQ